MSREIDQLLKLNLDSLQVKKFEILDLNGSSDLVLSTVSWTLYWRSDGSVLTSGTGTVNNADADKAGNTIKTVNFTLDMSLTDGVVGAAYLVLQVQLTTQQLDFFRFPVELVDLRTKGVS